MHNSWNATSVNMPGRRSFTARNAQVSVKVSQHFFFHFFTIFFFTAGNSQTIPSHVKLHRRSLPPPHPIGRLRPIQTVNRTQPIPDSMPKSPHWWPETFSNWPMASEKRYWPIAAKNPKSFHRSAFTVVSVCFCWAPAVKLSTNSCCWWNSTVTRTWRGIPGKFTKSTDYWWTIWRKTVWIHNIRGHRTIGNWVDRRQRTNDDAITSKMMDNSIIGLPLPMGCLYKMAIRFGRTIEVLCWACTKVIWGIWILPVTWWDQRDT